MWELASLQGGKAGKHSGLRALCFLDLLLTLLRTLPLLCKAPWGLHSSPSPWSLLSRGEHCSPRTRPPSKSP